MKIRDLDQGSPLWRSWRNEGLTASDVAVLQGVSPYKTEWRLWNEKLGILPEEDLSANPFVRRGKRLEHLLRERVAAERKLGLFPVCVEYAPYPFLRASLDGIDHLFRPWEFKVPSEGNFDEVDRLRDQSDPYKLNWHQVQAQLLCTGSQEGFLVFGAVNDTKGFEIISDQITFLVRADPAYQEKLLQKARLFEGRIKNRIEPDKDPQRDTFVPKNGYDIERWRQASAKLLPLLDRRASLERELEALSNEIEMASQDVIDVLGQNKVGDYAGLKVTKVTRKGSVKWDQLLTHSGKLPSDGLKDKFRKPPSIHYQLRRS